MKITVKTLQQKLFQVSRMLHLCTSNHSPSIQIEADGADTVADLKSKIAESQGHNVESQKLIYSGKFPLVQPFSQPRR